MAVSMTAPTDTHGPRPSALSTDRMIADERSDAMAGHVVWVPAKSLWTGAMTLIAIVAGPLTFAWDALALFIVTSAITICAGHSVGMHRLLIHRAFEAPLWLERLLVYLGTLVGMAGPFGMIHAHDIRDWAQRQPACHDLHAHRRGFFHDAWWQMHCAVALDHPPRFVIEPRIADDRFFQWLEWTWMLQQLPWAVLFYVLGGWAWVVWGIAVRVAVSLTGHWLIGHFAHKRGSQGWAVDGVAVQGYNVPYAGLVTFGEAYHGNHHAFPGSANLGVEAGQIDLGWRLIQAMAWLGLARQIQTPATVGEREGLRRVTGVRRGAEALSTTTVPPDRQIDRRF
jgi:sn-1 stearoyl-lipid 9-desaturase